MSADDTVRDAETIRNTWDDDSELVRRLEWATGSNGETLLRKIREEGLDVVKVTPEQVQP